MAQFVVDDYGTVPVLIYKILSGKIFKCLTCCNVHLKQMSFKILSFDFFFYL
jgi:hypothetical protein